MTTTFDCNTNGCARWEYSTNGGAAWQPGQSNGPEVVGAIQTAILRAIRAQDAGRQSWWYGDDAQYVTLIGYDPSRAVGADGQPSVPTPGAVRRNFEIDGIWGRATSLALAALADSDGLPGFVNAAMDSATTGRLANLDLFQYAMSLTCPSGTPALRCRVRFLDDDVTLPSFGMAPGSGRGVTVNRNNVPVINAPVTAARSGIANRVPTEQIPGLGAGSAMDVADRPILGRLAKVPWWGWVLAAGVAGAGGYAAYRATRKGRGKRGGSRTGRAAARARPRARSTRR
jgi:hypothetical protein